MNLKVTKSTSKLNLKKHERIFTYLNTKETKKYKKFWKQERNKRSLNDKIWEAQINMFFLPH
jgi:hypothetical protein